MGDAVGTMRAVIAETGKVVDGIGPDQLGNATPCTEWSVRDVINHITGGSTMFAVCVEQGSVPDDLLGQLLGGDNLGDDYKGAFHAATDRAVAAFGLPGALEKVVKLPFGEMPAGVALQIAVFDVATHACDLAHATGQKVENTEVLDAALEAGHQMIGADMRGTGLFEAEQPAPEGATTSEKLLAFAGRKI
jgi:uncharacterized protein (TIGR03086 family)